MTRVPRLYRKYLEQLEAVVEKQKAETIYDNFDFDSSSDFTN